MIITSMASSGRQIKSPPMSMAVCNSSMLIVAWVVMTGPMTIRSTSSSILPGVATGVAQRVSMRVRCLQSCWWIMSECIRSQVLQASAHFRLLPMLPQKLMTTIMI